MFRKLVLEIFKIENYKTLIRALRTEPWQLIYLNLRVKLSPRGDAIRHELAEKILYGSYLRKERRRAKRLAKKNKGREVFSFSAIQFQNSSKAVGKSNTDILGGGEFFLLDCRTDGERWSWQDLQRLTEGISTTHTVLLFPGIILSEYFQLFVSQAIFSNPDGNVFYGDHDEEGRVRPIFKPEWDDVLIAYQNYIGDLLIVETKFLREQAAQRMGGFHQYSLVVELMSSALYPIKINEILYHREKNARHSPDTSNLDKQTILQFLACHNQKVSEIRLHDSGVYQPIITLDDWPEVDIIIPFRDHVALLKRCIDSILEKTGYPRYRICLVNNDSKNPETLAYLKRMESSFEEIRVLDCPGEFNYSAINNRAVETSDSEYVLLLNNDTEVLSSDWLERMMSWCVRKDIGAVGAKLFYPDGTIQHAGVKLGRGNGAGHVFLGYPGDDSGYMNRLICSQKYEAVTAACLLTIREVYISLSGFDEKNLKIAFNDVDYCLRLKELGLSTVYCAEAQLIHWESKTRASDLSLQEKERYEKEACYLRHRYPEIENHGHSLYMRWLKA